MDLVESYREGIRFVRKPLQRALLGALLLALLALPLWGPASWLNRASLVWLTAIGVVGQNLLIGYAGLISFGQAGFLAIGAYAFAHLRIAGLPFLLALAAAGGAAGVAGWLVGFPSLRLKGPYLAIATLAGQFIIEWIINHVTFISGGVQASIEVARPRLFGMVLDSQRDMYYFLLFFVVLATIGTMNLVRSRVGRAFIAIRDQDIAAEIIGINIFRYKLLAFAISSFYAGATGVLYTYFLGIANYEQFQLGVSVDYLAMIIIGGLGSVQGSIFGAFFITLLPIVIRRTMEAFGGVFFEPQTVLNLIPNLRVMLFGGLIIFFLIVEPNGLARLWQITKEKLRLWPFPH